MDLMDKVHFGERAEISCMKVDKKTMKDEAAIQADQLEELKKQIMLVCLFVYRLVEREQER